MEDNPNFVNIELKAEDGATKPSARIPARPAVVLPALRKAAPYRSGGPLTSSTLATAGFGGFALT